MNVSVAEVLAGATVRAVPLSAECAGYLVLAAADQVSAAPRRVEPRDVLLTEDGAIRVAGGRATEAPTAEGDLRAVLDALLLRASAPTAGLLRASRREPGAGVEALVRELETALIPVNRSAARRSLARLERETVRAIESGRLAVAAAALEPKSTFGEASVKLESKLPVTRTPVKSEPAPAVTRAPAPSVAPPSVAASLLVLPSDAPTPVPPAVVALRPEVFDAALVFAPVPAAPPPPATEVERTEPLRERTVVLAPVAPKQSGETELVETRPEPVVKRASMRPPALPDPAKTEPLPPAELRAPTRESRAVPLLPIVMVDVESRPNVTPFLGTRVSVATSPLPPSERATNDEGSSYEEPNTAAEPRTAAEPSNDIDDIDDIDELESLHLVEEETSLAVELAPAQVFAEAPPAVTADGGFLDDGGFVDDGEVEIIEVIFDPQAMTVMRDDGELLFAEGADCTEPCPPVDAADEVEDLTPSDVAVLSVEAVYVAALSAEVETPNVAAEMDALNVSSEMNALNVSSEMDALNVSSEMDALNVVEDVNEVTPPPRVALPEQRSSDVDELLLRLHEIPLPVEDLRAGLRRLAGLDLTPPPPGLSLEP